MPDKGVERRLAAVLSADVAGYSRLMADDEQATVRTITAYRQLIGELVNDHRGRVVDATGDNVLAEFPTALDAVECAVEIQRALGESNADLQSHRRMEFRIGVHMGDITVEGERIYGDGVNIAARLEGMAKPAGICISGAVHEQVASKLKLQYDDMGEQSVKNILRPVRVFRVDDVLAVTPATATVSSVPSNRPSIVVLPFADMSPERDQEYFCDGMAEEVINALTQLENLHVVARTSAFYFKGRNVDVREIGSKLGVRSVLEGGVRKAGSRLRVTAQLIDVENGYHLWSERFDRRLDDVFAIQDEISAGIVEALKVQLAVGSSLAERPIANREAYDLFLRGRQFRWLQTEQGFRQALQYFDQALSLDPDFAAAHAHIGNVLGLLGAYGHMDHEEALEKGKQSALRALELDASVGKAHTALGLIRSFLSWDFDGAERDLKRAIELTPSDAEPRTNYGIACLLPTGRVEEAISQLRRAVEIDPIGLAENQNLAYALFCSRRYEEAISQLQVTLSMAPDLFLPHRMLALVYASNNMMRRSLDERRKMLQLEGRGTEMAALEAAFNEGGESGVLRFEIEHELKRVDGASARGIRSNFSFYSLACNYARLGEPDQAMRWLHEAERQHDGWVIMIKVHPWFDSLRGDPRFDEILRKMNLA